MHNNSVLTYLFDLSSCLGREEVEFMAHYHHIQTLAVEQLNPDAIAAWVWLVYDFAPPAVIGQNPALTFLHAIPKTAREEFLSCECGFSRERCGSRPLQIQEQIVEQLEQSPIDGAPSKVLFLRHLLYCCSYYLGFVTDPLFMNEDQTRRLLVLFGQQLERFNGIVPSHFISALARVPADPDYLPLFHQILFRIENPYQSDASVYTGIARNFFALTDLKTLSKEERKALTVRLRRTMKKSSYLAPDLKAMMDLLTNP